MRSMNSKLISSGSKAHGDGNAVDIHRALVARFLDINPITMTSRPPLPHLGDAWETTRTESN